MRGLENQSVLILGLGDSGLAMARWCVNHGAKVKVLDSRQSPPQLAHLQQTLPQVEFVHGSFDAHWIEGQDIRAVFKSPGLTPASVAPLWQAAKAAGLWIGTELTLFAQALQDLKTQQAYAPKVLAITGTNGKTTVTSLTSQLLERAGLRVATAGNIGPTLLDTLTKALAASEHQQAEALLAHDSEQDSTVEAVAPTEMATTITDEVSPEVQDNDEHEDNVVPQDALPFVPPAPPPPEHPYLPQVWVLELSSFQLDEVDVFEPTAATVLNVTQDHLDWHGSMGSYGAAKARIFGQQALMVLNREDPLVMAMLPEPIRARLQKPQYRAFVTFGSDLPQRPGDYGLETVNGMTWLVRAQDADETIKRKRGSAQEEDIFLQRLMPAQALRIRGRHNAMNALAALALANSTGASLAPMLYGLRAYRGEPHRVEPVRIIQDVEYIDDSKGTNVGATVAALQGLGPERRLVVILGGDGKGQDFTPLLEPIQQYARAVALIGRDAAVIHETLKACQIAIHEAVDLQAAVRWCGAQAQPGDAVLLSPACASLDMFENYAHRAQVFVDAVDALAHQAGEVS